MSVDLRAGKPAQQRIDEAATPEQIAIGAQLSPQQVTVSRLVGHRITNLLTAAPHDRTSIGWLRGLTRSGGFAARPSGTEEVDTLYAASFTGREPRGGIHEEAPAVIQRPPAAGAAG